LEKENMHHKSTPQSNHNQSTNGASKSMCKWYQMQSINKHKQIKSAGYMKSNSDQLTLKMVQ
jgi:hypothetical protein